MGNALQEVKNAMNDLIGILFYLLNFAIIYKMVNINEHEILHDYLKHALKKINTGLRNHVHSWTC